VNASRILLGKPPEAALKLVPLLFSLCGNAQAIAARRAVEAALGHVPSRAEQQQRRLVLAAEAAQELAVPMLLDWPLESVEGAGVQAARAVRAAAMGVFAGGGAGASAQLSESLQANQDLFALALNAAEQADQQWQISAPPLCLPCRPLPMLSAAQAAALFDDPQAGQLPQAPLWQDLPAETGPVARHGAGVSGNLAGRTAARVQELIDIGQFLRSAKAEGMPWAAEDIAASPGQGIGVGVAWTARGLLIHQVRVEQGQIREWTIVAPTEWTCHPQGSLVVGAQDWRRGLVAQGGDLCHPDDQERLQWGLNWIIRVFDPCVACKIVVEDAQSNA
jgi:Ni,Fe-hydrogenase I large subunit